MKISMSFILVLLSVALGSVESSGQTYTELPALKPVGFQAGPKVIGYLAGREPDFLDMLPPYPVFNSTQDETDVATLWRLQHPENSRWQLANSDEDLSYRPFSQTFGMEINGTTTPLLVHLLDRAEQDVQGVAFSAKSFYNRPRPFQRFQLAHVCGSEKPPAPEVPLKGGSSYPSGHMSFGWATVLILAEVAPERAQPLLARGREYGESRVVCAMHYPSDVVGGQLVATAVIAKLNAVSEFSRDLACAKQEYQAAVHPSAQITSECRTLEKKLDTKDQRAQ